MLQTDHISFKRLQLSDLPLICRWLNEPHVHEWYDDDKENTLEDVTTRYGPEVRGEEPTDGYLAFYEDKPVGYIQMCKVHDYPEFGPFLGYDNATAGVDLFIGEIDYMGKGLGNLMLKKFLKEIVFSRDDIQTCIIDPDPANIRAIKSYEKAGFTYVKTIDIPADPGGSYIMELRKVDVL